MKTKIIFSIVAGLSLIASAFICHAEEYHDDAVAGKAPFFTLTAQNLKKAKTPIDPFISSSVSAPPQSEYDGRLFQLRHDYPGQLPPSPAGGYPWKQVTNNGLITQENSNAYVEALKSYVSEDMRKLLYKYSEWDSLNEPWWESIWLGIEREPIHGMYVGSGFPAGTLTGQKLDLTTYVFTLYDKRAAVTLNKIWGTTTEQAFKPNLSNPGAQFAEGSVIIKFAFVTSCGKDWAPMVGAASWPIYFPLNESNGSGNNPKESKCSNSGSDGSTTIPAVTNVYLMQFDIIVKDSIAAPETGWVFSTLVYDTNAAGEDAWDRMIPLGATWGNNPEVINTAPSALTPPVTVNKELTQNWINPKSPTYAVSTLGWDGRLSGPNDGAVVTPAWATHHYYPQGLSSVGCLGCHSNAQYKQKSFLLPTTTYPPQVIAAPGTNTHQVLVLNEPGSKEWMKWFQSRQGTEPMDPGKGQIGLDYDMVTAFKAIPMWQAAVSAIKAKKAK